VLDLDSALYMGADEDAANIDSKEGVAPILLLLLSVVGLVLCIVLDLEREDKDDIHRAGMPLSVEYGEVDVHEVSSSRT